MNGLTTKYEKYLENLEKLREPEVPKVKLDMRGALEYAKRKGLLVCDLSDDEKSMFVTPLAKAQ